jgi:hypothetical protein
LRVVCVEGIIYLIVVGLELGVGMGVSPASAGDESATSMTTADSSAINRLFQNVTLTPPSSSLPLLVM